jgi:hypothetical protein
VGQHHRPARPRRRPQREEPVGPDTNRSGASRPARRAQPEEGQQSRAGGQPAGQAIKEGVPSTAKNADHATCQQCTSNA